MVGWVEVVGSQIVWNRPPVKTGLLLKQDLFYLLLESGGRIIVDYEDATGWTPISAAQPVWA